MIKIKRLSDSIDYSDKYRVILDNKIIMELVNGELRDYNVTEGEHTLKIISDNYVSEVVKFNIYDGQIIEFECKPDHKDNKVSLFTRKIFLGKLGISLTKKTDFYL